MNYLERYLNGELEKVWDELKARAYSANEPWANPKTLSPGLKRVTFSPTASTTPATSVPEVVSLGLRHPPVNKPIKSRSEGMVKPRQSFAFTDAA